MGRVDKLGIGSGGRRGRRWGAGRKDIGSFWLVHLDSWRCRRDELGQAGGGYTRTSRICTDHIELEVPGCPRRGTWRPPGI